jgi:hypothetical protein
MEARKGIQIRVHVVQDVDGNCQVHEVILEPDGTEGEPKVVAIFPADSIMVPVMGEFGPELAQRDLAEIRALIFTTTMERLVNDGSVEIY